MDRHAKKNLCQDKTTDQTSHSPRYPNASTNATAGTNRRNAKDKRTIPLDHPRTGPNNSSYVMDGSTRGTSLAVECDRAVLVRGGKPRSLRLGGYAVGATQRARVEAREGVSLTIPNKHQCAHRVNYMLLIHVVERTHALAGSLGAGGLLVRNAASPNRSPSPARAVPVA